jgi:hypothetical protein
MFPVIGFLAIVIFLYIQGVYIIRKSKKVCLDFIAPKQVFSVFSFFNDLLEHRKHHTEFIYEDVEILTFDLDYNERVNYKKIHELLRMALYDTEDQKSSTVLKGRNYILDYLGQNMESLSNNEFFDAVEFLLTIHSDKEVKLRSLNINNQIIYKIIFSLTHHVEFQLIGFPNIGNTCYM